MDEAWTEHLAARDDREFERREREASAVLAASLADIRLGGYRVEILTDDASCAECRKFAGHVFDPRAVPVLPYDRCRNELCRCDYIPVVEWPASRTVAGRSLS
jgi:hypothetical protein